MGIPNEEVSCGNSQIEGIDDEEKVGISIKNLREWPDRMTRDVLPRASGFSEGILRSRITAIPQIRQVPPIDESSAIMKFLTKLAVIFDRTLDVMVVFAGALLAFAVLSVSAAIASRYFLGYPLGWVNEINSYILLYIPFLVGAWVLREEGHVIIDILLERLNPRNQSLINIITSMVSAVVCFILAWYGAVDTWDLFQTNYFTPTQLELPKWIISVIIFIGSFFLFVQFLRRAYLYLKGRKMRHLREESPGTVQEFEL
jgi:TRAP-type C4-dicarboxylate transport system permease small subunit